MPVEMGSFDVIISMDWLAKYHAVIVCDEKLVRAPFGDKTLIFHGDRSNNGHESRLNIISCTKTQKYLLEGCPIFLAHVTMKKAEDKSKEKQLEEVPIVQTCLRYIRDLPVWVFMGNFSLPKLVPSKYWASPKSATEIRQFLGLAGYYRRFIEGFSKIAKPMTKLTQKKIKFDWWTRRAAFLRSSIRSKDLEALSVRDKMLQCSLTQSLLTFLDQKELNMRQRRWLELLIE
ncbi:hypothetical protein Tco_0658102 [Tanacetum coccineum]